jgi:hypothetical protein
MRCELLRTNQTLDAIGQYLVTNFIPLLNEFWKAHGETFYGKPSWSASMAPSLGTMALQRTLTLYTAFDDGDAPAGFIFGTPSQHLLTDSVVFVVEMWYGRTPEISELLFRSLGEGLRGQFMKVDMATFPTYAGVEVPAAALAMSGRVTEKRFVCLGF